MIATLARAFETGRFPFGRLMLTRGVNDLAAESEPAARAVLVALRRHGAGDWGEVDPEDRGLNDAALTSGERVLSVYSCPGSPDGKVWVITEADRSATTVLFPSEY